VQVKNGPLDFMQREPFHPLFGAMTQTPVMAELQITQEYLGHSRHLVYLAPMWKEFFDADTFARGPGSTVAKAVDGSLHDYAITGVAGVANTGSDANWTGHHFGQANWYAFGRLAWDPNLAPEQIADEWLAMTFSTDADTRGKLREMMLGSWDALINYSMPLGLHHLIAGDHYAPAPWNAKEPRDDWTAVYYHRADEQGVGFDRTRRGSGAVDQYFPLLRDRFDNVATCPETLLLWFHRVPWDHKMKSGRTLWDELCFKYNAGFEQAQRMAATWDSLADKIDAQRHREVAERLRIQVDHARAWRDQCVAYFQKFSKQPIPAWRVPTTQPAWQEPK
jgi:alpha-glucuronidase